MVDYLSISTQRGESAMSKRKKDPIKIKDEYHGPNLDPDIQGSKGMLSNRKIHKLERQKAKELKK